MIDQNCMRKNCPPDIIQSIVKNNTVHMRRMCGAMIFHLITWRHGRVEQDNTEINITPRAATRIESVKNNNPSRAMALAGDGSHEKNTLLFSF